MNEKAHAQHSLADCPSSRDMMYQLLQAAHAIERRLEDALGKVELSAPKYGALSVLVQAGEPISLSELAHRLTCVRSNITQLVDRLESDGLVRRVDDPADRRGIRAEVTPLGLRRQAAGERAVAKVQDELAGAIEGLDHAALSSALAAIR
jgi:DNA-binding MarR family transcriptional regulator